MPQYFVIISRHNQEIPLQNNWVFIRYSIHVKKLHNQKKKGNRSLQVNKEKVQINFRK